MAYDTLLKKMVQDAILNKTPGLNIRVDFKFFVSEGAYDPDTDTKQEVYNVVEKVVVVEVKPTFEDVQTYGVSAKSKKLLVPGLSVPQEPNNEVDRVIILGKEWTIKKVVGVPGNSLWTVFVTET